MMRSAMVCRGKHCKRCDVFGAQYRCWCDKDTSLLSRESFDAQPIPQQCPHRAAQEKETTPPVVTKPP